MASLPYGSPVIFVCLNAQRWLLSLLLVGMLIGFVTNAAAQTVPQTTLDLGSMSGINLNLILPVTLNDDTPDTADDKVYYYVDRNGNGTTTHSDDDRLNGGDAVNGTMLDNLFNGGDNVIVTQEPDAPFVFGMPGATGDHDGTDDERSVIVGRYVLVLPTINELHALYLDQGNMQPTDWAGDELYRSATLHPTNNNRHFAYPFDAGARGVSGLEDGNTNGRFAVQVIALPAVRPNAAPADVTASPIADGTLRIDWAAVPALDNGGTPILTYTATATATFTGDAATCTADGTATTCTITGLTNGTIYSIVVAATNSVGTGPASTAFTVIPGTPAAPTGVTLDPGFQKIVVTWTPVPDEDDGGDTITGYRTRLFNSPLIGNEGSPREDACTVGGATANTCTISGLTNGNRYRVVVHAINGRGDSIASSNAFATLSGVFCTTDTIADCTTDRVDDRTFSVGQPDVTINLPPATQGIAPYTYTLTRSDGDTQLLPSGLAFNPATRTISGTPGEAFGVNGGVELAYTATDSDTPPDISTLTFSLTVNDDTLRLGSRNGINFNLRYPVILNGGTPNEKVYYYNDHNNNARAERTLQGRTGDDINRPNLRSLLNDGNDILETQSGGHDGTLDARSVLVNAYTLVLPTIAEMEALDPRVPATWFNGSYHTALRADGHRRFNVDNGSSRAGIDGIPWPVAFQVIITDPTAPTAAPTGVTALPTTDGALRIAWTAVPTRDNGGRTITAYTATATATGQTDQICTAAGATATTCDIMDLANGETYSVRVVATNSAGDSLPSDSVTAIPGRPGKPTDVILTAGVGQIVVEWTPPANNGGFAILSYEAAADISADEADMHGVPGGIRQRCTATGPTATTCPLNGLDNGVEHRVVVRAFNTHGNSGDSDPVFATPRAVFFFRIKVFLEGAQ